MGTRGWEDLDLAEVGPGRYTTTISECWQLAVAPQGGIVAAIATRAMDHYLAHPEQTLRTLTVMFAGQVAGGAGKVRALYTLDGRARASP